jgi:hypothetical protein
VSADFEGEAMKVSPAEMTTEIEAWLYSVRRSLILRSTDWRCSLVLAGLHGNSNHNGNLNQAATCTKRSLNIAVPNGGPADNFLQRT